MNKYTSLDNAKPSIDRVLKLDTANSCNFAVMLTRSLSIIILLVLALSCGRSKLPGRFIAETDTAFSQDVRDISAKINKNPQNAELWYRRGNTFFYQDRYKDAAMDMETAVTLDSLNALYHFRLGETMLKMDSANSRKSKRHLEKAVQLKPDFNEANLLLAKYFLARQEYDKAEAILKKLTGVADYSDKSFVFLGICSKEKKDTVNAILYFEKALQQNTQNYDAALQVALLKANTINTDAMQYFNRAIAINEAAEEAWYGKGLLSQQLGKYQQALECYDKTSGINPAHTFALYNSAVVYSLTSNWIKTEEYCNRLLKLDETANTYALRGYSYEKRGKKEKAAEDYRTALKLDPANEPALAGLKAIGY